MDIQQVQSVHTYMDTDYLYFNLEILEKLGYATGRSKIAKIYSFGGIRVLPTCDITDRVISWTIEKNSLSRSRYINVHFI